MEIYKLGCNWGKGKPSFYNYIKENKVVIGVSNKRYSIGDLILITEGFTVYAIVVVTSKWKTVTSMLDLKKDFEKYQINFE
ncbi:MAG: hypothetical protein GXO47_09445, partial [Chlorobi bacterium]|nr:hypothetical protein [Chlorobiota bacterium]